MKLYIDTREKIEHIQHIMKRFDELGISYERKKLDTGDYVHKDDANSKNIHIVIDRKGGGLDELSNNLGIDRIRFHKELKRAKDNNIHLIILIADEHRTRLKDVLDWTPAFKCPERTMDGKMLYSLMQDVIIKYHGAIFFQFCKPDEMADEIVRLLSFGH